MALTKKEQAAFAALEDKVATRSALCPRVGDDAPAPDLLAANLRSEMNVGWTTIGATTISARVVPALSEANGHKTSHSGDDLWDILPDERRHGWSQQGRDLYSSKVDALRALRAKLEEVFGRELAKIDAAIREGEVTMGGKVSDDQTCITNPNR